MIVTEDISVDEVVLDRLFAPLGECLTLDTARRIANLRADSELQAQVDQLADKANAGTLSEEERSQYQRYLQFAQFVTLLQIRARDIIDAAVGPK